MKAGLLKKKNKITVTNDDIHNKLDHTVVGESEPTFVRRWGKKRTIRLVLAVAATVLVIGGAAGVIYYKNKPEPPKPQPVQSTPPEDLDWSKMFEYKVEKK